MYQRQPNELSTANPSIYLYSEEIRTIGLPARAKIVRYLSLGRTLRKAAVLALDQPAYKDGVVNVVVVGKGCSLISEAVIGDEVGVYVLPLDDRTRSDEIDLTGGLQPVLDWGALTMDLERASKMQVG